MSVPVQNLGKIPDSIIEGLIYLGFILWLIVPVLIIIILVQVISIKKILGKKEKPSQTSSEPPSAETTSP